MLLLLIQIREDWYALEASPVVEVLPLIKFKAIANAPRGLAGIFSYHGCPVPLVDVGELIAAVPTQVKMRARIVLTKVSLDREQPPVLIGLLVEQLMETLRRTEADFVDSGGGASPSPYLGAVTMDRGRIIHRIEVGGLLSGSLTAHLVPTGARGR